MSASDGIPETVATQETRQAVSPLPWRKGSWNAGHFPFDSASLAEPSQFGSDTAREESNASPRGSHAETPLAATPAALASRSPAPTLLRATDPKPATSKSTLTPTAAPFVFAPKPSLARRATSPTLLPPYEFGNGYDMPMGDARTASAEDRGAVEVRGSWSFNSRGLSIGGHPVPAEREPQYSFFDGTEQYTRLPFQRASTTYAGRIDGLDAARPTRRGSIPDNDAHVLSRGLPSPTGRFGVPTASDAFRARANSISGSSAQSSYGGTYVGSYLNQQFGSPTRQARHTPASLALDRASAVQQLQTYFGPSSVEVSPSSFTFPLHDVPYPLLDDSPLATSGLNPLSHLPLGYQYQTDPDDLLYTQARQTFVQQSLSTLMASTGAVANLNDPQLILSRTAMMQHFDQAMHSANPLASLYGLSPDAVRLLAMDPESSGVSESVLRLAAARGTRASLDAMDVYGLPGGPQGPSANNRKLGLYKTELCRNWEEKGSCRYGSRCQYAHGSHEIRDVSRHPKFKTEECRTFWQSGSCGYGKRCCFIHTTVPGGPQSPASPPDSLAGALNGFTFNDLPDTPPFESNPSSPQRRLVALAPAKGFGPALANYLGETSPVPRQSSSNGSSAPASGRGDEQAKDRFAKEMSSGGLFGIPLGEDGGSSYGLGIKYGGNAAASARFTNNPSEVPPQFQEPPQSRLQRLAGRGSVSGDTFGFNRAPVPSTPTNSGARHLAHPSLSALSSASSSGSILNDASSFSPFLPRAESSSSISSSGGHSKKASLSSGCTLQPASNDWLGASGRTSHSTSSSVDAKRHATLLGWSEDQDYLLDYHSALESHPPAQHLAPETGEQPVPRATQNLDGLFKNH